MQGNSWTTVGRNLRVAASFNTDMMRLEKDGYELIVYAAAVRDVVLAATNVQLWLENPITPV